MILPDVRLPRRARQSWQYSGIDSHRDCLDRKHFTKFPHKISYDYNSRGFRDQEWPETVEELRQAIWCIGDSFTVGIGSPLAHTWPYMLGQATQTRTINVSMDGASNNWIARRAQEIIEHVGPKTMVIQWSYITRREAPLGPLLEKSWQAFYSAVRDSSWPDCNHQDINLLPSEILDEINEVHGGWHPNISDEDRLVKAVPCTDDDDIANTVNCINCLMANRQATQIIHSFIPEFQPDYLRGEVESRIVGTVIPEIKRLDLARDGHHYDILTSGQFVQRVIELLNP